MISPRLGSCGIPFLSFTSVASEPVPYPSAHYVSSDLGFESQCVHFGHPSAGGCQRSTGDPRLILGKGYRLVVLGGYGRTDPLHNKHLFPNGGKGGMASGGDGSTEVGGATCAAASDSPAAASGGDARVLQAHAGPPAAGAGVAAWYLIQRQQQHQPLLSHQPQQQQRQQQT
ncbi:unnamed protein product [Closterium sp. NIES-54]